MNHLISLNQSSGLSETMRKTLKLLVDKRVLILAASGIGYIFFASSSGGTQAGLTLGKDLFGLNAELMAVSIDKTETQGLSLEQVVLNILREEKNLFGFEKDYRLEEIRLIKGYDENGYGVVTNDELFAIKELATSEGIVLDPVYTARAFYGMLDHLKNKKIPTGSNVLFWHTGGLPANFYYADQLQ